MIEFQDTKFYKLLQDFFINNDKETFLQMLAEFYNRTEGIIIKNNTQDEIIKELREMYIKFNEEGIDENIVREKVNYVIENSNKIQDIIAKLIKNTNNIENITSQMEHIENNINNICYTIDKSITLNNSLNTLINNIKGGKIVIPPGEYTLDGEIIINKSNIELVFLKGSKIIVNYVDKNVLTILPSLENIKITGFNVTGNADRMNDQYSIVVGRNCKNITIRDCYLDNFNGGIMLVANNSLVTIDNNKFSNMIFPTDNSEANGCGKTGGYGVVLQGANNCHVSKNYFDKTV